MKCIKKLFSHTALGVFLFAALMLVCTAFPTNAQAATQYENREFYSSSDIQRRKIGNTYFWYDWYRGTLQSSSTVSGSKFTIYAPKSNEKMLMTIVSNGTNVYYAVQRNGSSTATVYLTNIKSKTRKTVCTYRTSYGEFKGYYNNKVYLMKWNAEYEDAGKRITTYDRKTGKYRTIKKAVGYFKQYGRYFGCSNPSGFPVPVKFYIYNAYTEKNTTLSYRSDISSFQNGKLYYTDWNSSYTKAVIRVCSVNGSSKKTVASFTNAQPGSFATAYGPTYAVVTEYLNSGTRRTKVDYKTGRKTPATEADFRKLLYY